jgi:hypothetical protein
MVAKHFKEACPSEITDLASIRRPPTTRYDNDGSPWASLKTTSFRWEKGSPLCSPQVLITDIETSKTSDKIFNIFLS